MTEDEAKGKWCPLARTEVQGRAPANRYIDNSEVVLIGAAMCIGSACMAWRSYNSESWDKENANIRQGYCGAFGKP